MDFSFPSLSQMVAGIAWPSSWRWVAKGDDREAKREKVDDKDPEEEVDEKGEDIKSDVEEEKQEEEVVQEAAKEEKDVLAKAEEMLKTEPRSQIEVEISIIEKPTVATREDDDEEKGVIAMLEETEEPKSEEEREMEIIIVENTLVEEVKVEDSLLNITAQIMENVLEDVWRSHQSCVEDISAENLLDIAAPEEPLPKSNDTIADLWMEMNRKAEEEMDRERDELIEELIVDLDDDDFEVIIAREKSFEIIEEDSNANENKAEHLEVNIELDENIQSLEGEEDQIKADVHLECRAAGQECGGTIEQTGFGGRRALVDIFRLPKHLGEVKTARMSVKVNIQNEAVENIKDLELGIKGNKNKRRVKSVAKNAILIAGSKKRKVEASIGQLFSSNGNDNPENASKRTKVEANKQTEVNKQTKSGTNKPKKRVVWTRSATRVSVGGSEEKVIFYQT